MKNEELLVPLDDNVEALGEHMAVHLLTFAATYREVRKALQAARVARDQRKLTAGSFI